MRSGPTHPPTHPNPNLNASLLPAPPTHPSTQHPTTPPTHPRPAELLKFCTDMEAAVIKTVEAGHMTKDLAICVHGTTKASARPGPPRRG